MMEQKSDRELLVLAAKAAGYRIKNEIVDSSDELLGFRIKERLLAGAWNPLTDDGDALRLAVQLSITVAHDDGGSGHYAEWIVDDEMEASLVEHHTMGYDAFAATRRAVVLAAAEIGASA